MQHTRGLGEWYEEEAGRYLETLGYRILTKNYRFKRYELDIIALTPQEILVFVEVKYRKTSTAFPGEQAFTTQQQKRLMLAAEGFLMAYPSFRGCAARYDAILFSSSIGATRSSKKKGPRLKKSAQNYDNIKHLKNVFEHNPN